MNVSPERERGTKTVETYDTRLPCCPRMGDGVCL